MLRIHFTADDLGRLRIAEHANPMWETVLSLHQLVRPEPFFGTWSRWMRAHHSTPRFRADVRHLMTLAPPVSYFADFLTPALGDEEALDVDIGIDRVLATNSHRLQRDLDRLAEHHVPSPAWFDDLACGRLAALRRLGATLRSYHAHGVAPYASAISGHFAHDRESLARWILARGSEAALNRLAPIARWQSPVLAVDYPVDRDLRLNGRGLTLVPSFFCGRRPVALADPDLPPVLVYPAARAPLWFPLAEDVRNPHALDALLGPTRAAVLRALDVGRSTGELAAYANISPSAASRHATVLSRAGLIRTERSGRSVRHTRTSLGNRLVHGD